MNPRDLLDQVRTAFVTNSGVSPTREITYTRFVDESETVLNAFVGAGLFNKEEREAIGRYQSFGGLVLSFTPEVNDTVQYDGVDWKVVRYTKLGPLFTVFAENKRHNGRPRL